MTSFDPSSTLPCRGRRLAAATAIVGALLLGLAGCSSTSTKESASEYSRDALVTTRIKAALLGEASLKSLSINVKTYRGTVALSGFVDSVDQITRAVAVTRNVEGVEALRNDLHVKPE